MFSSGVLKVAALLLPLQAATAAAQMPWGRSFTDEGIGATYTIAIPEVPSAPFPLLMSISVPRDVSWAGFATGGCMLRSPLIVAWVNGTSLAVTTRWAPYFHAPLPYLNTTISVFPSASAVNETHWTATFVCSRGCSDWYGGAIDPTYNNATFGYAASSRPITDPRNVTSRIGFHDLAISHFDFDLTKARRPVDEFHAIIENLGRGGTVNMH